ncbi:hypothetical protein N8642_01295 [bacterium]|nr:hypothetical protein [bacterium]
MSPCVGFSVVGQQPAVDSVELPSTPISGLEESLASLEVADGFRIEPVAWEPMVVDPVAMAFDEWGRLFVVEMRDYSERRPERLGRVRILEDRDLDGVMDHSTVFVDELPWPTAVICYDGGIFVGSTPDIIFCKDQDGDGRAEIQQKVFTGFASDYAPYQTNRLNVQALMNSFRWGIDNRIHGATSASGGKVRSIEAPEADAINLRGRDFSFDPRTLDIRAEAGGAQHGMSFDNVGQKFVCSNSDHIQQVVYPYRYLGLNPRLSALGPRVSIADDGAAAPVYRLSPDEPWRVIRTKWRVAGSVAGPVEGGGRPSGYFTGATGVTIYRGDQWPASHIGNALIGDCGSNLIHRKRVIPNGILNVASRYPEDSASEFVASTDNWFRPVQFANAPDGSMWVADMSREVIEHPWSLPENIKRHLDLNHGNQAGRIYRIASIENEVEHDRSLGGLSADSLVKVLAHPNGWHRDTASRLLIERPDSTTKESLFSLFRETPNDLARVHALYILNSHSWLGSKEIEAGLADSSPVVRIHSLRLLELQNEELDSHLEKLVSSLVLDPDERVVHQVSLSLGYLRYSNRLSDLYRLSKRCGDKPWLQFAVLNSMGSDLPKVWEKIVNDLGFWNQSEKRQQFIDIATLASSELSSEQLSNSFAVCSKLEDVAMGRQLALALLRKGRLSSRELGQYRVVLAPIIRDTTLTVREGIASSNQLVESMELLGKLRVPQLVELVNVVLDRDSSSELVVQSLRVCQELKDPSLLALAEERFHRFLPAARRQFLSLYFETSIRLERILDWIDAGQLAVRELSDRQKSLLLKHKDSRIRERAGLLLARKRVDGEEAMSSLLPALLTDANIEKGKHYFVERCILCHQIGTLGVAVGPAVASMRGLRKRGILEAVLFPNREVAPQYFGITVAHDSGTETGILRGESDRSITIRQAGGTDLTLVKSSITSIRSEGVSLMPEGLLEGLEVQEVADLLEFIMYEGIGQ